MYYDLYKTHVKTCKQASCDTKLISAALKAKTRANNRNKCLTYTYNYKAIENNNSLYGIAAITIKRHSLSSSGSYRE